ncbi:hypothetical protein JK358_23735 [Nocardia sp. 2]|uniref:Sporulation protein n=2 Tax=Nocardia acididurans TaxID=2802282 RepID=A0ABS1MB23_9NOCA|nr:hypothetical protein [Nocardia acididurans]MBL1077419.1 hypothetical protein [Nocardia acididurans]
MLQDRLSELTAAHRALVYGEPYETSDGSTVITVTGGLFHPRPLGVFVVHGGEVKWEAAVDDTRIALLGILTGLIAAAFATAAVFKRPPWPDLRITQRL